MTQTNSSISNPIGPVQDYLDRLYIWNQKATSLKNGNDAQKLKFKIIQDNLITCLVTIAHLKQYAHSENSSEYWRTNDAIKKCSTLSLEKISYLRKCISNLCKYN